MTKHYKKDNLTVVWQPEKCIHSTHCWKELQEVFNPTTQPWINMDGAEAERIKEQVTRCPSGALSYEESDVSADADNIETDVTTSVEAMRNGPLMVYGNIKVKDGKGNEMKRSKVTAFCRCGASANKPFCDGTHIRVGFEG